MTEREQGERIGWSAACSMVRAALYDSERRCLNEANTRYAEMNVADTVEQRKQAKKAGRAWQRVAEAHQAVSVALTEVLMRHEGAHEHLRDTARAVPYPRMADDQLVAARLAAELERVKADLQDVYTQRNRLVTLAAMLAVQLGLPAGKRQHQPDPEPGWSAVVHIELPTGQVSWHLPDADAARFLAGLPEYAGSWDGHTTDDKHARIEAFLKELKS